MQFGLKPTFATKLTSGSWQRLEQALEPHEVRWHWVKGHAGHLENERADELARAGLEQAR